MSEPIPCEAARLLLSSLLAGSVEPDQLPALDRHLQSCAHCGAFAGELVSQDLDLREFVVRSSLRVTSRVMEGVDSASAPSSRRRARPWASRGRPGPGRWRWALGIAAVGLFAVGLFFLPARPSVPSSSKESQAARKAARDAESRREAAAIARAEREALERELARREEERVRLTEDLKRVQDAKARGDLKAREAELAKAAEAFQERLRLAREKERQAAEAVAQADAAPAPPAPKTQETRAAVAKVGQAENAVVVTKEGERVPARAGQDVLAGQVLEVPAGGSARLEFPDQTGVEVGPETEIRELKAEGGKRVFIAKGGIRAEVAKQPQGQPMVFATRDGEAAVVGTTLRIIVDPDPKKGTRLEVEEGKVRLKNLAGKTVTVESGHYAVAAAGVELAAKVLPIEEILLTPRDGKGYGDSWKVVRDADAATGTALETGARTYKWDEPYGSRPAFAVFRFKADANKDYVVWLRGRCLATQGGGRQDCVALEAVSGQFDRKYSWQGKTLNENVYLFDGLCDVEGYGWVSGFMEKASPVAPAVIRFNRPGEQILKLHVVEGPLRVDAIWLSATQRTRPDPGQRGPSGEQK